MPSDPAIFRTTRKMQLDGYRKQESAMCMVELEIDLDYVFQRLGNSAFRNKTKRSRGLNGAVTVRVRPALSDRA
jgi:hypothetical protein